MKIGVLTFLTEKSGNPGDIARTAEDLGFESFWVAEHMAVPTTYTTYYPRSADGKVPDFFAHLADPFVALSAAAQTTSRINIGTAICLLPEREILSIAKATATLDLYSKGRLIFGVGAGWFREEAEILGVKFDKRWLHLREGVEALRTLWSQDEASYQGEIIKFPPIKLFPKPVQKPYPRIFLGAHDPKHAPKRVARYADGWFPAGLTPQQARETLPEIRRLAKVYGRDPEKIEFGVVLLAQGDGLTLDVMKEYQEAGISRIIVSASAAATSSGVEAVKAIAAVVERGQKI